MTRQSVLDDIRKENEVYTIRIKGSEKDKADAFYILMTTQQLFSGEKDVFHGLKNMALDLLRRAEIDFEIIKALSTAEDKNNHSNSSNSSSLG